MSGESSGAGKRKRKEISLLEAFANGSSLRGLTPSPAASSSSSGTTFQPNPPARSYSMKHQQPTNAMEMFESFAHDLSYQDQFPTFHTATGSRPNSRPGSSAGSQQPRAGNFHPPADYAQALTHQSQSKAAPKRSSTVQAVSSISGRGSVQNLLQAQPRTLVMAPKTNTNSDLGANEPYLYPHFPTVHTEVMSINRRNHQVDVSFIHGGDNIMAAPFRSTAGRTQYLFDLLQEVSDFNQTNSLLRDHNISLPYDVTSVTVCIGNYLRIQHHVNFTQNRTPQENLNLYHHSSTIELNKTWRKMASISIYVEVRLPVLPARLPRPAPLNSARGTGRTLSTNANKRGRTW